MLQSRHARFPDGKNAIARLLQGGHARVRRVKHVRAYFRGGLTVAFQERLHSRRLCNGRDEDIDVRAGEHLRGQFVE